MKFYKCDRCGKEFTYERERVIYTLDESGRFEEKSVDLCESCEDSLVRATTNFMYGDKAYAERKGTHDYVMSYAL